MPRVWTICGAGRRVGKTYLAERLCEVLPNSEYVKQGHGRPKAGKCPAFFRSPEKARAFVESRCGARDHVVVESNALARAGFGDTIVFIDAPPGRADVRRDAAQLRAAAALRVRALAPRRSWQAALARALPDAALRKKVAQLLADQAAFLARCRLAASTKVWLVAGGRHVFGRGLEELLAEIDRTGSLRAAAGAARMSYRYAWNLIRSAESHLGRSLVIARPGGAGGGGTKLSLDGRHLLKIFHRLEADVAAFAARRFARLYGKDAADG